MKKRLLIPVILFCAVLVSCNKDDEAKPAKEEKQAAAKAFLKDIVSDAPSEFYISGEFDGHNIYLASRNGDFSPSNDTLMNAWFYNADIGLDNIHFVRQNRARTVTIGIYFLQSNLLNQKLPYIMPRSSNLVYCESVQMELINMKKLGTTAQNAPNDDFSFFGHTDRNIGVRVHSVKDSIAEGTFQGVITTNTGASVVVKNGKFRIKFIIRDETKVPAS